MADPVDFDALAKKHGAVESNEGMDLDALAKQHGALGLGVPRPTRNADLPADLPQKVVEKGLEALPYLGATAGALLAPEGLLAWPAIAAAGAGAGVGSMAEQGVRTAAGLRGAPTSAKEFAKQTGSDVLFKGALPEAGGRVVGSALKNTLGRYLNARRLYAGGMKPSGTDYKKAANYVETGLRERIPLTEAAPQIAEQRWQGLNKQIESMIQGSNADIPPQQYVQRISGKLDELRKFYQKDAVSGKAFVDQIDTLEREFLQQHGNIAPIQKTVMVPSPQGLVGPNGKPLMVGQTVTIGPEDMSLAELRRQARPISAQSAQGIKKKTYDTIRKGTNQPSQVTAWDASSHPALATEVRQNIAQGLKEELEQIFPQIKGLNRREGDLIALEEQLGRFVKREGNKQNTPFSAFLLSGMGAVAGGMAGGATGAAEGAAAPWAAYLVRAAFEDPGIKSRIAILLNRAGQLPGASAARFVGRQLPQGGIRGVQLGVQQPSPWQVPPVPGQ